MSTVVSLICLGPSFQKMTHHFLLHGSLRPTNLEKNLKPCRKSRYNTFQNANNKGADQTARMCRLVCAFVVRKPPEDIFLSPISYHIRNVRLLCSNVLCSWCHVLASIGTVSANSLESGLGCTLRIYFDNVTDIS